MQLLIILALLLYGGRNGSNNLLTEVKPVLETLGGEDIKEALKSAEEITQMLSAVREITGNQTPFQSGKDAEIKNTWAPTEENNVNTNGISFPLAPISNVANREITYSLSKYLD